MQKNTILEWYGEMNLRGDEASLVRWREKKENTIHLLSNYIFDPKAFDFEVEILCVLMCSLMKANLIGGGAQSVGTMVEFHTNFLFKIKCHSQMLHNIFFNIMKKINFY